MQIPWWCGAGVNVGIEISGKGERFARPILILKKLSRYGFMGVPLASKPKSDLDKVKVGFRKIYGQKCSLNHKIEGVVGIPKYTLIVARRLIFAKILMNIPNSCELGYTYSWWGLGLLYIRQ